MLCGSASAEGKKKKKNLRKSDMMGSLATEPERENLMQVRIWHLLLFWAIAVLGAQLPMFVLAQSIDEDEQAKACFGWVISALFASIAGAVLYAMITGKLPGLGRLYGSNEKKPKETDE